MNKIVKGSLATGKLIGKIYITAIKCGVFFIVMPYLIPFFILANKKKK